MATILDDKMITKRATSELARLATSGRLEDWQRVKDVYYWAMKRKDPASVRKWNDLCEELPEMARLIVKDSQDRVIAADEARVGTDELLCKAEKRGGRQEVTHRHKFPKGMRRAIRRSRTGRTRQRPR